MSGRSGSGKCLGLVFLLAAVSGPACSAVAAEGKAAPAADALKFVASGKEFRFDTGVLAGTLRRGGRSLGLTPVTDKATGARLAGGHGLMSHYRLLSADGRYGHGAWDWPSTARLLDDGAVEARWASDAKHPLDMKVVYRWARADALDVTTTVTARKPLGRMEVFLASYFAGLAEPFVYARGGPGAKGAFLPARRSEGVWQMFPRDATAVQTIKDGRWKRPPNPVDWKIRPALAAPLAMRRGAKTNQKNLAALVMAPAADCFAVATPYAGEGHRSLYFCLLGRDLKAGEAATVRSRLVIGREISDEKAVALYKAYLRELADADKARK